MSFNRKISKFLAAVTIGSSTVSCFNSCIFGMEKSNEVSKDKYQLASDEIVIMFKDFIDKNNLQNDTAKWMVAFDILSFVKKNFDKDNIDYLKKNQNEKMSLNLIHKILLKCMLEPEKETPFESFNRCLLSIKRLNFFGKALTKKFCNCLMVRLKNICCRNTMSEDERIENFINILENVPLTSLDGEIKGIDSLEDTLKKRYTDGCEICYNSHSYMCNIVPCKHRICESCLNKHSLKQRDDFGKEIQTCPFCCQQISDYIVDLERYN